MNSSRYQPWVNLLTLLPGTSLTLLTIAVAFLRFYNEQDFRFLGYLTQPRVWSNRLTVAALVVAVVNFGVEWNLRNRETNRLAEAEQRRGEAEARAENERTEERNRAGEERERAARRARIQNRWIILQVQYQVAPGEDTRAALGNFVAFLQEYGE
ncbi:MAG: hypothetical protein ACKO21_10155 [Nodosilinea sp.]